MKSSSFEASIKDSLNNLISSSIALQFIVLFEFCRTKCFENCMVQFDSKVFPLDLSIVGVMCFWHFDEKWVFCCLMEQTDSYLPLISI